LGEPNGFDDLYGPGQTEMQMLQARLKLKTLISPQGMGGIFKILVQSRGVSEAKLTGLKF
jgi:SAM-dependent MidA family methyltransferase